MFVWDGSLDSRVLPALVARAVGQTVRGEMEPWPRLHGKRLEGKLRYAVIRAETRGAQGVVAVLDGDRVGCPEKLNILRAARRALLQERPPYPIGLGCAAPHAEAWLIDDAVAVRNALRLAVDADVPNVRRCESPKNELIRLHDESERSGDLRSEVWGEIAQRVDERRCAHADETGFRSFVEDVRDELRGFR